MDFLCMDIEPLAINRINFGKTQIRNTKDIKKGKVYIRHVSSCSMKHFLCMGKPFKKSNEWWVRGYLYCAGIEREKTISLISLGDCGVTPYSNGMWNPAAWLEEEKKKKKEKKLIKRMSNYHPRHPVAGRGL